MDEKIRAWHFATDDRMLRDKSMEIVPGYIYTEDGPIVICESGLHASRKCIDALSYAPGAYLTLVDCWGEVEEQSDKFVCRHREVIAAADVTRELRLWACWCVRQQWHNLTDERSRNAVVVAEKFANGEATIEQLAAARDAAWASAWAAARAAAWDAAWDAAWAAARAAASAAARAAQSEELERVMMYAVMKGGVRC